jgi:hypothetical protein
MRRLGLHRPLSAIKLHSIRTIAAHKYLLCRSFFVQKLSQIATWFSHLLERHKLRLKCFKLSTTRRADYHDEWQRSWREVILKCLILAVCSYSLPWLRGLGITAQK